jgi:hypothetical protein
MYVYYEYKHWSTDIYIYICACVLYIYITYMNLHSCKAKHCKANIAKPTVDRFIIYIYIEK